ncbi:MAG: division plane positioning ATPase MipZ [Caulobacteraceae bacterium]
MSQTRIIVIGNEKGGAGKSTVAVHLATHLLHEGAKVLVLDLDVRQQSTGHFFANRAAWTAAAGAHLPTPIGVPAIAEPAALGEALETGADFIIVDTPGADTELSRTAHQRADVIVTPMNDSFVDFDMLGVIDPVSLELVRPSLYAETVWEARKQRAMERGRSLDWIVLRNRLASTEPRNRRRVDERLAALSRRVGFRAIAGLRDRVIYRELYPFGLTVADLCKTVRPVQVSLSQLAARQELRVLMQELGLGALADPAIAAE